MILTVTPNPAIDSTWTVSGLTSGTSHRVSPGTNRAGGKGINVARVLAAQNFPTAIVCTAGGANGIYLADGIRALDIPYELVTVRAETRRSLAFYDSAVDDTVIVNESGSNNSSDEWAHFLAVTEQKLASSSVAVISGSLPGNCDPRLIAALVDAAYTAGASSIVDTTGEGLITAARAGASLLKPNRGELTTATGENNVLAASRRLISEGAGSVLVSLGREGLLLVSGDNTATPPTLRGASAPLLARLPVPLSGNPSGAGDAAVAAVAVSLLLSETPHELLRRATSWSAAAVLMPLAGEISHRHAELAVLVEITSAPL